MHRRAITAALLTALILLPAVLIAHANPRETSVAIAAAAPATRSTRSHSLPSAKRRSDVGPPATVPVLAVIARAHQILATMFPTTTTTTTTTVPSPPTTTAPVAQSATVYPASFQPCGGDYPPCWRVATESGGNYSAYNRTGCTATIGGVHYVGCWGKWQFGFFWAGRLGLPADITTSTPAQQDEAARLLWNHGAGCSNWSAC